MYVRFNSNSSDLIVQHSDFCIVKNRPPTAIIVVKWFKRVNIELNYFVYNSKIADFDNLNIYLSSKLKKQKISISNLIPKKSNILYCNGT